MKWLALALLFFSHFSLSSKLIEKIQAQVDEEMISLIDLKNFRKQIQGEWLASSLLRQTSFTKSQLLKSKKKLLDFMIIRNMLSQLAEKEVMKNPPSQKKVEAVVRRLRGSSSHTSFSIKLKKAGLSLKTLKREILRDLQIDRLLTQSVVSKVKVSEQDIESWHFNKYGQPLFKNFEYEFVSVQFSEKEKPAVLKSLSQGTVEDLEDLALALGLELKDYRLQEEEIQGQFKKELSRLSVSQISPLLVTGNFYYVLQLKWKYPVIRQREQKRKARIEKLLYKKKLAEETEKWIEEQKTGFSIVRHSL